LSEKRISVEEVLQRIDQLLDVLRTISKDLAEISRSLRATGVVAPTPAPVSGERLRSVADVRGLFPRDLEDMLVFEEVGKFVIVKPRQYLGSENFAKVASVVRGVGGEYVSAGKESHFRVPREIR